MALALIGVNGLNERHNKSDRVQNYGHTLLNQEDPVDAVRGPHVTPSSAISARRTHTFSRSCVLRVFGAQVVSWERISIESRRVDQTVRNKVRQV